MVRTLEKEKDLSAAVLRWLSAEVRTLRKAITELEKRTLDYPKLDLTWDALHPSRPEPPPGCTGKRKVAFAPAEIFIFNPDAPPFVPSLAAAACGEPVSAGHQDAVASIASPGAGGKATSIGCDTAQPAAASPPDTAASSAVGSACGGAAGNGSPSLGTPQVLPEPPPPLQPLALQPGHLPVLLPTQQPPRHAIQQLLPQPPQRPAAAVFCEKAAEQRLWEVPAESGRLRSFVASTDAGRAQQLQESESKVRELTSELTKQLGQRLDKADEMRLAAGKRIAEVESELEKLKATKPDQIASKPGIDTRTADAAERWSAACRVAELAAQVQQQQEEPKTIGCDTAPSGATVHDPEAVDWEAFYGGLGGLYFQRLEEPVDWEAFYGNLGGVYPRRLDGPLVDPPPQSKEDVLVFSDAYGFCTEIGEQVPSGCVGSWTVQRQAADKYTEKGVKHLVSTRPWDLIMFALGVDPPRSRRGVYFRKHQADVVKAFGTVLRAIRGDASRGKRLAVLTVDCFNEESDFHEDNCDCDSPLYWQCRGDTGVQCPIKFIDTEWERSPENIEHIRDELFRYESSGLNVVRILSKGCYRLRRRRPSEAGREGGSEPESEYEETGSEEESEEEESEEEEERGSEADLAFAAEQWAQECEYEGDTEFEDLHY